MAVQRRLAAILAADVVGYSRLMGEDEEGTRARFNQLIEIVVEPTLAAHDGRLVKTMGDGFLVEFNSVVEAVQCAADIQTGVGTHQRDLPEDQKMLFRIGVHLGDVLVEGEDIHGDGVNIAARLEGLAEPGGICISDMVHAGVRKKLSLGFEALGERSLRNIADPLPVFRVVLDKITNDGAASSNALFRRPAVAVLPFENMSGDPEQEYFADGLTEDIITALSLWKTFPVIARNSTFAFKGKSADVREVGETVGARYVVEGSVRKAGNRVRVTAQLINAETGHHVWAEKYDRDLEDIFELQDEITLRIAAIIEPAIKSAEQKRLSSKPPTDLNAWDLCIQGYSMIYRVTKEDNERAREKFLKAIELDPEYARAWTGLAYTYGRDFRMRFTDDPKAAAKKALEAARRAVALDETDSDARLMFSRGLNMTGQPENALPEAQRAVELNPQNSMANWNLGFFLNRAGRAEEGIPWIEKAREINPLDPQDYVIRTHLATAKLCVGDYEAAAELARSAISKRPDYIDSRVVLAAALGYLGRVDKAQEAIGEFREEAREYVEYSAPALRGKHIVDCFLVGLQKAHLID